MAAKQLHSQGLRRSIPVLAALLAVALLSGAVSGQGPRRRIHKAAKPVSGRYIVVLNDDSDSRGRAHESRGRAEANGARIPHKFEQTLNGFVMEAPEYVAQRLLDDDPRVAYIEEDGEEELLDTTPVHAWGIDRIDQRNLPRDGYFTTGESGDVDIWIIDTGIRYTHREFQDPVYGPRVGAIDFTGEAGREDGSDCDGHGTHVAGTIVGNTLGIARRVMGTITAARVFDCVTGTAKTSNVIAAIEHIASVAKPGRTVVNMSLGMDASIYGAQAQDDAVRKAIQKGIVFVVAAGNEKADASSKSPARVAEAITVGATDDHDVRAKFSNTGTGVDIFAPGAGIQSAWIDADDDTAFASGTSMAAPHVTGVVALYLASFSSHSSAGSFGAVPPTPAQVEAWLIAQSTKNVLTDIPSGTPNRLLYMGGLNDSAGFMVHPFRMRPGQRYVTSVAMRNTGVTSWLSTVSNPYLLGNRSGSGLWNVTTVPLSRPTCCGAVPEVESGELGVFNFEVVAPATPGTYPFNWQMLRSPSEWFGDQSGPGMLGGASNTVQVGNWADDAEFVSQTVPQQMLPGGRYEVSIKMKNRGPSNWIADWNGFGGYWLGSISEAQVGQMDWGVNRIDPSTELPIPPGTIVTFTFQVIAPKTVGWHRFQWQMMRPNGVGGPFGSPTPWTDIFVGSTTSISSNPPVTTITSLAPGNGAPGASVVINGTNFSTPSFPGPSSVRFNGVLASFTTNSSTQLTATVPTGASSGRITVTTPLGTAASIDDFWVTPTISTLSPTTGAAGVEVTIAGTQLDAVSAVTFNGVAATFTPVSPTVVKAIVPPGATTGVVAVTTPGGVARSATSFSVISSLAITSFLPAKGAPGDSVAIKGAGFTGVTAVRFNGVSATAFTVVSAAAIAVTVPAQATTGPITVTTTAGTATSPSAFLVSPRISGLNPTSAQAGASVVISGANFSGATIVNFNGVGTSFVVNSSTKITATVPATATTGKVSVTAPGGTGVSSGVFTVKPFITGFSPTSGAVGAAVIISGTTFTGATAVSFNGKAAAFTVNSATNITATVPKGATSGPISVTTAAGKATSAGKFIVQ